MKRLYFSIAICLLIGSVTNPVHAQYGYGVKNSTNLITPQEQLKLSHEKLCCPTDGMELQKENYLNNALFWMGILLATCGGIFSILLFRSKWIIKK